MISSHTHPGTQVFLTESMMNPEVLLTQSAMQVFIMSCLLVDRGTGTSGVSNVSTLQPRVHSWICGRGGEVKRGGEGR